MISGGPKYHIAIHKYLISIVTSNEWLSFICLSGLLLIPSCKEGPSIQTQGLNGKWEIYSASRNGTETPYLRGGYFIFDASGTLTVNITGKDDRSVYEIDDNEIILKNKANYTIKSLRKDSMDIHYVMNPESEFMFFLKKTSNEKH